MQILVLGINHKTADLQTREKLAFTDKQAERAYLYLLKQSEIFETVIISTCNRTEIYAYAANVEAAKNGLIAMLRVVKNMNFSELEKALYYYYGCAAVSHLFTVTAGLDSMIIGETQILGQVKEAYERAVLKGSVGKVMHGLFQQAISSAKKVQTETMINHNSVSISYVAVEMIRKELGSFENLKVLVIGAGKMSRLTLKHLHAFGAKDIRVTSRTYQRAKDLAHLFNGQTLDFQRKKEMLPEIDIIISSTGAPHYILHHEDLVPVMEKRRHRPIFIIDIAVPRDIDPAVRDLKNVFLFDMDSLQQEVSTNQQNRQKEAAVAANMISAAAEDFQTWFRILEVEPIIGALRNKAEKIRKEMTDKYLHNNLCNLSDKEKLAVENLTKSFTNAIFKEPILRLKENARLKKNGEHIGSMLYLFDLDEDVPEKCLDLDKGDAH